MQATENGGNKVVSRLVEHIRQSGMKPGDRLPSIRTLAGRLKLGPNLVREGMLQIQTMGLVKIHPRAGVFVKSLDFSPLVNALEATLSTALSNQDQSLFDLIDARILVEIETAGLAAARRRTEDLLPLHQALEAMNKEAGNYAAFIEADRQFHLAIARVGSNAVLISFLDSLLTMLGPFRTRHVLESKDMAYTNESHHRLYRLIMAGDADEARIEMRNHLGHARQKLLASVQKSPGGRGRSPRMDKLAG